MKYVLVTWSSSGIGYAIALELLNQWFGIIAHYRNNAQWIQSLTKLWKQKGLPVFSYRCELSDESQVRWLFEFVIHSTAWIDILINNAWWYMGDGDERDGNPEVWMQTYQKNIFPVLLCSKYFWNYFLENRKWVIVNIASRHAIAWQSDSISYASSKAAIVNITQAYAKLLAPHGTANAFSPWAVNTWYRLRAPQDEIDENLKSIRMEKLIEPEEIAKHIVSFCMNNACMTGQNILIDWGYSLI